MQNNPAPLALFVYNRPQHTQQTLHSLSKNFLAEQSHLFIFSDGPKKNANREQLEKIKEVRKLIRSKNWTGKVEIIERSENLGLANSVISGITEVLKHNEKIIVLEDDLVTSAGFLNFMNAALELYKNDKRVMHVSGYMFPVKETLPDTFFYNSTSCWGWGTWARSWKKFILQPDELLRKLEESGRVNEFKLSSGVDVETLLKNSLAGKIDSWAVRWHASVFLENGLCLHPGKSLVRNIGHDISGINCKPGWWSKLYLNQKVAAGIPVTPIPMNEHTEAKEAVKKFFKIISNPPLGVRIKEKVKSMINTTAL